MKFWISWDKHSTERYYNRPYISDSKPKKIKRAGYARFYQMTDEDASRTDAVIAERLGVKEGDCVEFNIERVES